MSKHAREESPDEPSCGASFAAPPAKKQKLNHAIPSKSPLPAIPQDMLTPATEETVGITRFLSPEILPFTGVLKHRYTDFLVNEVDQTGTVVHLTDLESLPVEQTASASVPQELSNEEALSALVGAERAAAFMAYCTTLQSTQPMPSTTTEFVFEGLSSKATRTSLHQLIRERFPGLTSEAVETAASPSTSVRVAPKPAGRAAGRGRRDNAWPPHRPKYLSFVLYKENRDTTAAVQLVAKVLGLSPKTISFAGMKDKRGVTVQRMTAFKVAAERLKEASRRLPPGVCVGNYDYVAEGLRLGDLRGNRFGITLRNVSAEGGEPHLREAVAALQARGFVNYFGLQRFGTSSIPTFQLGRALLQANWWLAIALLLAPNDDGGPKTEFVRTLDIDEALRRLPRWCTAQRAVLAGLRSHGWSAPLNALSMIPLHLRLMYVHAYQSYVWNHMASRRLELYGSRVVAGDLVLPASAANASAPVPLQEEEKDSAPADEVAVMDVPAETAVKLVQQGEEQLYSLNDVVLPLPGYAVCYPAHELATCYKEFLERDRVPLHEKRPQWEYSLPGGYRRMVEHPKDVEYAILKYDEPDQTLAETDLMRLRRTSTPEALPPVTTNPVSGRFTALQIHFTLPSATYATMCLRELMKQKTEGAYHSELFRAAMSGSGEQEGKGEAEALE